MLAHSVILPPSCLSGDLMSSVPSWEAGMEDATRTDLASWPQMPCSCVVQASSPRGAEHPARTTSTYRILLNTNTTPEPPRGHPCPSSPPAAPRTAGQGTREVLTAATEPGCAGRGARAGRAAGCGSAVCGEGGKGQGLGRRAASPTPGTVLARSGAHASR